MNKVIIIGICCILGLSGCSRKETLFKTVSGDTSGISFVNALTESENLNILDYLYYYNGGGVAIGDINNDGLPDIYFTGNQVKNKLYLNKGNLKFEDITDTAGVAGSSDWNTGAVMADVNGDGLLDIYVLAVVGINGFDGHNELFINKGDSTFSEQSAAYGLDLDNYSSSAAFLDYDLDGDLDIYLLNHAIHNQTSFGKAEIRNNRTYESGDKLLRNDGNKFTDVSAEAGIYGGPNGYGLGVAISDFNQDGYPDIYVGNDFHEDDYFYVNNRDGTFAEMGKEYFGHTSRFSMGNDVADINHDGFPDLISLDMLPDDERVLKASAGDDNVAMLEMRINQLGYHYQYSRNMLQINNDGRSFSEAGLLSGIAATDWSWSALFNDYDQDGEEDLFVANGIPKRPNDLDYINFTSNDQIRNKLDNTKLVDQQALKLMPSGFVNNRIFRGNGDLTFTDKSGVWISKDTIISNGAAYGDLDNDGDLDLVTNNLNLEPTLYINQTDKKHASLIVSLKYKDRNPFGIGAKVALYAGNKVQFKELYTVRGFQSSSEPILHFGLGTQRVIDSLFITWPNGKVQGLKNIKTDQKLKIAYDETKCVVGKPLAASTEIFSRVEGNLGLDYRHEENPFIDFDFQKLIPYRVSDRGPATAVGDLDKDGKEDVFFGASSRNLPQIYLQKDSSFVKMDSAFQKSEGIYEDVRSAISDFDEDGNSDLFVVTGGSQFKGHTPAIRDRMYKMEGNKMIKEDFPEYFTNGAALALADYDNDGDTDIFVGNSSNPLDFGHTAPSYILKNDGGKFQIQKMKALESLGIATDAIFTDFDNDGQLDLIVVGEWMQPKFLKNEGGGFKDVTKIYLSEKLNGLWQSIAPFDIDGDGDLDYLLGNWGTNTKFKATEEFPMLMYYGDFDHNSATETIVAIEENGKYYPVASLDELSSQLVSLVKKKFPTYKEFAGKDLYEIFDKDLLEKGTLYTANTLKSGYLKNENGKFIFYPFSNYLQLAPINKFLVADFDGDSKDEALAAGNYFGVTPYNGRYDGFDGALIKDEGTVLRGSQIGLDFMQKAVRDLNVITVGREKYVLVTVNEGEVQLYKF
ncbi:VCBS repeat-containing protein [Flavobacteriaceae bacterium F89]|uniref:VCBS repeat-containing protein n=1 Tax=Cerina litoralis TaxID=2874477 RepID=A0AAE3EX59_9FLAO|nr:VCBS repeat-containing protein [Cerina litoralis]MCG2462747.1 VCBS repeat-containing protein [Cerina litoralis]